MALGCAHCPPPPSRTPLLKLVLLGLGTADQTSFKKCGRLVRTPGCHFSVRVTVCSFPVIPYCSLPPAVCPLDSALSAGQNGAVGEVRSLLTVLAARRGCSSGLLSPEPRFLTAAQTGTDAAAHPQAQREGNGPVRWGAFHNPHWHYAKGQLSKPGQRSRRLSESKMFLRVSLGKQKYSGASSPSAAWAASLFHRGSQPGGACHTRWCFSSGPVL